MGENSIDLSEPLVKPITSYEWVICNHVLEHIPKLDIGFRNLADLAGDNGIIQITVPMPTHLPFTEDWGFSDASILGHWRHFGSDIVGILTKAYPSKSLLVVTAKDFASEYTDTIFIVAHESQVKDICTILYEWNRGKNPRPFICLSILN